MFAKINVEFMNIQYYESRSIKAVFNLLKASKLIYLDSLQLYKKASRI